MEPSSFYLDPISDLRSGYSRSPHLEYAAAGGSFSAALPVLKRSACVCVCVCVVHVQTKEKRQAKRARKDEAAKVRADATMLAGLGVWKVCISDATLL